ncbi:Ribonuclease BN [Histomonas meleagridis]|uniref:Ribonuclease BN n=1 Tax=Histomonas meleagridis TaxID=135588 RepID=UPI003559E919|nr:Ribonuclease BN [Histomonas meleagridis]KAH0805707.1 Ribonuclease BN [Histomonas meleagridis]
MKAVCLGSGGYFTTETNFTVCFMVPELGIIFDCGSGLFRASKYIQTKDLHIFLSHAHLDHIIGLGNVKVLNAKIYIHATQSVLDSLDVILNPPFVGSHPNYIGVPLDKENPVCLENGSKIYHFDVAHSCPCKGFRLEYNGKSLCFITDTTSNAESSYLQYAKNSNLLIHECYYTNEKKKLSHTCPEDLIEFLKLANPEKTLTIHHNPNGNKGQLLNELKKQIPNIECAEENKEYLI